MPSIPRALPAALTLSGLLACALPVTVRAGDEVGQMDGHAQLAELALARGAWVEAAREYVRAARASNDPAMAERATRIAFENNQLEATIAGAHRWLELKPGDEVAERHLATALLRRHAIDESASHFGAVLERAYSDQAQGYMALLGVLVDESNQYGAALVMEQLSARHPDLAEAQYARSVLWQRADNGERALAAVREALKLKPDWRLAQLAEVRALLTADQIDRGLSRAKELAADGDPLSQLNYAWLLISEERAAEARAVLDGLLKSRTAVAEALEALGAMDYDRRDYAQATTRFNEITRLTGNSDTASWYLGLIAEQQGDRRTAVRHLSRITTGSRAVSAQLRACRLLLELDAPTEAEALLDDFLAGNPAQTPTLAAGRATLLADRGQAADGLRVLDRAISGYPDDDDLALARAFLLERMDRVDDALAAMRRVLARRPGDPAVQNAIGYTLVDRGRRAKEGHALIEQALAARPDSFAIQDSMGWALFKLGRVPEALPHLERAWRRSKDPEVAAHLGEVWWSMGRRDEARALWEKVLADHPDSRPIKRAMERRP
jgi:tetratricopeptide (TPR) repeat protein